MIAILQFFSVVVLLLSYSNESLINVGESELENNFGSVVFVAAVVRHGDRSPFRYFKKYNNTKLWKEGLGQLSNLGKQQEYELGIYLRNRYDKLLGKYYNKELIEAQSSNFDRTLMSAYCILAGMYPPQGSNIWNPDLNWQPIPVHTVSKRSDMVIAVNKDCDRTLLEINAINKDPAVVNLYESQKSTIDYVLDHIGIKKHVNIYKTFGVLSNVYDTLMVESLYNFTIPKWSTEVFPYPLKYYSIQYDVLSSFSPVILRTKIGQLFKTVSEDMDLVVSNKSLKRFQLYSGHDTTIKNILRSLDSYDSLIPYSAAILFELRRKQDEHFVTVMYRNTTDNGQHLLKLEYENYKFRYHQFKEIISKYFVEDWEEHCRVSFFENFYYQYSDVIQQYWCISVICFIGGIVFMITIYRWSCIEGKKNQNLFVINK